jgi:hypothetical protein
VRVAQVNNIRLKCVNAAKDCVKRVLGCQEADSELKWHSVDDVNIVQIKSNQIIYSPPTRYITKVAAV